MDKKKRKRKNKPGAGRPHLILDTERIADLAFNGCNNNEIALILGCEPETLKSNYSDIVEKKRAERRAALKEKQTDKALRGDTTMLIWLGKNELEQKDSQKVEHSGAIKTGDKLTIHVVHTRPGADGGNGNGQGDKVIKK